MKITLLLIGKTESSNIEDIINGYVKRLSHYINFEIVIIKGLKHSSKLSFALQKIKEGALILDKTKKFDFVVLLDEKGKQLTSVEFSKFIETKMTIGIKNVAFVIGGPYGFSDDVYKSYSSNNNRISLSKMTFSHQMVRLIFIEQLYRAMTIIKGEPYHHK